MQLLLISLMLLTFGGAAALLAGRSNKASALGAASAIAGSLCALVPVALMLFSHGPAITDTLLGISLPIGRITLLLDPLAALFLAPVLLVSLLCACYGFSSLSQHANKKHLGAHWFFYNILIVGLILTMTASNTFLFMVSWELMSLAPFFLLTLYDERPKARYGAWIYLIAAHIGALFLLAFFILLSSKHGGTLAFDVFLQNAGTFSGGGLLFILAFIGFGAKAGIMPMHVWLPETYPEAPAHVAGIMSGALSTSGIYGIMRSLTFLGTGDHWWAYVLIGAGAFSALLGIFLAMGQGAIKRSLAYSSVENMGIICMAIGFSLFALKTGKDALAALCTLGAMMHMFNHSLYKCLLFLSAGSMARTTGTDVLHQLGGVQKRMPFVGACFALGAIAICALPPLNGFAGEFVLYIGLAFGGSIDAGAGFIYWAGIFVLACAGGFSLLCFTRLYAIAFLGNPRTPLPAQAHEPPRLEQATLATLCGLCLCSAFASPAIGRIFLAALQPYQATLSLAPELSALYNLSGLATTFNSAAEKTLQDIFLVLRSANLGFLVFLALVAILFLWRKYLLSGRTVSTSPTWDCGYIAPTPRMQYTGGGFSQPAMHFMRGMLHPKMELYKTADYFPNKGKAVFASPDWITTSWYTPLFKACFRIAFLSKRMQHGRVNTYILYILVTLVVLLAWKIG